MRAGTGAAGASPVLTALRALIPSHWLRAKTRAVSAAISSGFGTFSVWTTPMSAYTWWLVAGSVPGPCRIVRFLPSAPTPLRLPTTSFPRCLSMSTLPGYHAVGISPSKTGVLVPPSYS